MELFAIIGSMPVAFAATAIYFFALRWVLARQPWLKAILGPVSVLILAALTIEWMLLGTIGTLRSRALIGPLFYPVHLVLFLLSVPALANVLILKRERHEPETWAEVAILCSVLALPVVLAQYSVSETLHGVDGSGGPYGHH